MTLDSYSGPVRRVPADSDITDVFRGERRAAIRKQARERREQERKEWRGYVILALVTVAAIYGSFAVIAWSVAAYK